MPAYWIQDADRAPVVCSGLMARPRSQRFYSKKREVATTSTGCNHLVGLDWRKGAFLAELTTQTNQVVPIYERKDDS